METALFSNDQSQYTEAVYSDVLVSFTGKQFAAAAPKVLFSVILCLACATGPSRIRLCAKCGGPEHKHKGKSL